MPLNETPFKRMPVDIVVLIEPMTDKRNMCIFVMVDYVSSDPEAVVLHSIETERVADTLVDMSSKLCEPQEILTYCGVYVRVDE